MVHQSSNDSCYETRNRTQLLPRKRGNNAPIVRRIEQSGTGFLHGPNFLFWSPVQSLESCLSLTENWARLVTQKVTYSFISSSQSMWAQTKQDTQDRKPTRRETKELWPKAKEELEFLGRYLPKQRLVRAIGILSDARKRRFLRRRQPKYGSMNKGFTYDELVKFFNALEDSKAILLFKYQAVLGLRIGEAVKIHIKDLNLKTKELRIDTEKGKRTDYLPIPNQLFNETIDFITQNEQEICSHKGYLFCAEYYPGRNNCPYISVGYARILFDKAIRKAKMDETYGIAEGTRPKLLHRLTTHSLRHYAVSNFARKNNGNVVLTSRFARHTSPQTTMIYIHTEKEELYRSMLNAQEDGILNRVRTLQGITNV